MPDNSTVTHGALREQIQKHLDVTVNDIITQYGHDDLEDDEEREPLIRRVKHEELIVQGMIDLLGSINGDTSFDIGLVAMGESVEKELHFKGVVLINSGDQFGRALVEHLLVVRLKAMELEIKEMLRLIPDDFSDRD